MYKILNKSQDWEKVGFQGKDPSTDFRGTGKLGYINLHYLVNEHFEDAKELLSIAQSKRYEYFFACAGINITHHLKKCYNKPSFLGHLGMSRTKESLLKRFNEIYCETFKMFIDYWKGHKLNTTFMNFNTVLVIYLLFYF